jgi:cytosine/adenosine deaminase-related metal-dependent hydrolase
MSAVAMHAEWIAPLDGPVVHDGWVVADRGRIAYVGAELPARFAGLPHVDLGRGALLPGWVNSHCHLEFGDLSEPIPMPSGGTIVDWLKAVMAYRRTQSVSDSQGLAERREHALVAGVMEAWRSGTRWIVDNATMPWRAQWIAHAKNACEQSLPHRVREALVPRGCIEVQTCFEVVDVNRDRWDVTWQHCVTQLDAQIAARLERSEQKDEPKFAAVCGIAPHAPYTASLQATQFALETCRARGVLWSMHLAESVQERQWLESRSGPFADWISPILDAQHLDHVGTVEEHLKRAAASGATGLVVHGNDLNPSEIDRIAASNGRLAVVYCPRTHAFFGHAAHPWPQLVQRGIPAMLGTDSRASNPDLSMWKECQTAADRLQPKRICQVLQAATVDPARFLGLQVGTLAVGSPSQLTWLAWEGDAPRFTQSTALGDSEEQWWRWVLQQARSQPLELHPIWSRPHG